ncbi:Serine/threonine-protein kinase rio1 [Collariella sp. IMI 366227]|nr:Serine/threonine-protein kinase rio1 [Collariella sp. IMI 366227]
MADPQEPPVAEFDNVHLDDGHDDDYIDDILELDDDESPKSYNRQDHGASASAKPTANTSARVDDQIAELSRHAAKIRLDNVKGDTGRDKDKADRATAELVLDQRTRMILLQMINRGVVSEVHGAISTGKEANVYGAVLYPEDGGEPIQRAIKIYKTAILVFKDRERYITGEHRFKAGAEKGNSRKMVQLWAEKEFRNLRRLHDAGIDCPEPLVLKLHVLVMDFLGDRRGYAYPRLRDARLSGEDVDEQWQALYVQLVGIMRRLFQVCNLVHADLSEYNILYNDGRLHIIDVSQSVGQDHPRALEFLRMDIKNIGDFFRRKGVDTLEDRTIFNFIVAPEGPVDDPELSAAIEHLYEVRPAAADTEEAAAAIEVDNEVFRNQFIPRTLDEVYDLEKEAKPEEDPLYKHMLAEKVAEKEGAEEASEDESSGDSDENSEDESRFEKGTPRGKKHEDKDEKRAHKAAVKEAKREKRKEKMPKSMKKRLVTTTTRKKK